VPGERRCGLEVKVRRVDGPRVVADLAQDVAELDVGADAHDDAAQVHVAGQPPAAMVDTHAMWPVGEGDARITRPAADATAIVLAGMNHFGAPVFGSCEAPPSPTPTGPSLGFQR
jgi:hypothetical protein